MKLNNIFLAASALFFAQHVSAQCTATFSTVIDSATKTATFTTSTTGNCGILAFGMQHYWSFGDGQTVQETTGSTTSMKTNVYTTAGDYIVFYSLERVINANGDTDNYTAFRDTITIPVAVGLEENNNESNTQTFPNPFHNQISIQYDLNQNSEVEVALFDAMGKKVATLQNGQQIAGRQIIEWNSQQLPSGVYFVRVAVDNKTKTIKVSKL